MDLVNLIFQYIPLDYVLIIGGLIVVGEMLKKFTTLPNYFLTTALPLLGAALMGIIYLTSAEILVAADLIKQICIGLLMGWAATGGYEFFKNTFLNKENKIKKEIIYTDKKEEVKEESLLEIEPIENIQKEENE